ncbi:hypothetical protein KAFR_0B02440 [Kazachstania africana CBS 2517]|uniref:Uncharacterized protein n=1 Tax=Kazachstania africana (strain ATCC 22294 / BCRC 22015 / CBS 2517 / CECT 1963 / NBRC 1671 / NRRL Y-8276) TaxID=1071382 RepID=H2AQ92_KAZAF|nr:hypothetical protein KAFR_0B02440 [Kazachstania africana CBS 2517]CCF56542.1 hypothetical protein KAFR_0B02440 [Kazachstania africana CBS 2517]
MNSTSILPAASTDSSSLYSSNSIVSSTSIASSSRFSPRSNSTTDLFEIPLSVTLTKKSSNSNNACFNYINPNLKRRNTVGHHYQQKSTQNSISYNDYIFRTIPELDNLGRYGMRHSNITRSESVSYNRNCQPINQLPTIPVLNVNNNQISNHDLKTLAKSSAQQNLSLHLKLPQPLPPVQSTHSNNNHSNNNNQDNNNNNNNNSYSKSRSRHRSHKSSGSNSRPYSNQLSAIPERRSYQSQNNLHRQYINHPHFQNRTFHPKNELSPYQLQKIQMRQPFTFANGEVFTPKYQLKRSRSCTTQRFGSASNKCFKLDNTVVTTTIIEKVAVKPNESTIKRSKSTSKFGAFFKKFLPSSSSKTSLSTLTSSSSSSSTPSSPTPVSGVMDAQPSSPPSSLMHARHDQDKVFSTSSSLESASSISTVETIVQPNVKQPKANPDFELIEKMNKLVISENQTVMDKKTLQTSSRKSNTCVGALDASSTTADCEDLKAVRFSDKVHVHETFSFSDYERTGSVTNINKKDTFYDKANSFKIREIRDEVNQYKRNEMMVHVDSVKYTHFFR